MSHTIVVIPCYNEAARLNVDAFVGFVRTHRDVQLLFVNDGSGDGTGAMLDELRAAAPGALLVHHLARNGGKAEAVRQGLRAALERRPDYVGFWDADLATPLEDIPIFQSILEARPEIEMVFGSRVNLLGRRVRRQLFRHYVGRVFATVASAILRLPIYDTQCGAKMFRVNDTLVSMLDQPFLSKWIFDVEIIARLMRARRGTSQPQARDVIVEHPLMVWNDVKGSKLKAHDFLLVAGDLARIYWAYLRPGRTTGA